VAARNNLKSGLKQTSIKRKTFCPNGVISKKSKPSIPQDYAEIWG